MWSKSTPTFPAARAPASNAGRNGRMPTAQARPMPWQMSRKRCTFAGRSAHEGIRAPRRTTTHRVSRRDLERYAGLFAARTQVMKSSAMRDLMASPSGPRSSRWPAACPTRRRSRPRCYAEIQEQVAESTARALQYAPTEGLGAVKHCVAEVMAAEGMRVDPDDVLVTTGGQQVIDLVAKTLIDPGDVIVAEAPTYPGPSPRSAPTRPTWCRSAWTTTACGSTSSRRRSTGSSARAGARSSSTPFRPSRTPPG